MTSYRNSEYQLPYSGQVDASGGGALSDSFGSGPQLIDDAGTAVPGYTMLDPAWVTGYTDNGFNDILQLAAVNARLGSAELQAQVGGDEQKGAWFFRALPPLVPEVEQQFHLYGRSTMGSIKPPIVEEPDVVPFVPSYMDAFQQAVHGMWVGQAGGPMSPEFAGGWLVGQAFGFNGDPYVYSGMWDTDPYGKISPYWTVVGQLPYYRVRVRQKLKLDGNVSMTLGFELGSTGTDWLSFELFTEEDVPPEYAIQAYGFFVAGNGSGDFTPEPSRMVMSAYVDFLRYSPQPFDDRAATVGGGHFLGAP